MVPEAFFDCLQIASELSAPMGGVSRMDIQRIGFLSCLLSIYQSKPVAEWGYKFANTGAGTPFSDQLNDAVTRLLAAGHLADADTRMSITGTGKTMLGTLSGLHSIASRISCVNAAAASMLVVPLSTMTEGLEQEPTVAASQLRSGATMLLDDPHVQTLHDHFGVLSQVIPPSTGDLLSPSVLWLSYMSHTKVSEHSAGSGSDFVPETTQ